MFLDRFLSVPQLSAQKNATSRPVAVISGGTSGLGLVIADHFARGGYDVAIIGRDRGRLAEAADRLAVHGGDVMVLGGDVTDPDRTAAMFDELRQRFSRLDALVNCVGQSDRGLTQSLTSDRLIELMNTNLVSTLVCSRAALPLLRQSGGAVVNIGSLASHLATRYLGGYPAAKHALAALTRQMRLEWRAEGVHVGLVSPGPIRRVDEGVRYQQQAEEDPNLPAAAMQPGGGAKLKGLDPNVVAAAVLRCVRRREPERILPGHVRWLVIIAAINPRIADWLLLRLTGGSQ